ncbi:vWA domain-containing protein [Rhodosalinus sediminis]|uniref:vWA domain-containing protein n=1 Tax=Rhodosalinus sediminis TaxID=1940533 RepID=UPI002353262A|nr:hypothetical protein [Rhodosalinus sediminis]
MIRIAHLAAAALVAAFGVQAFAQEDDAATGSGASLAEQIETELRAWEEALSSREAAPPPEGSRAAVRAEIAALSGPIAPDARARIESVVREAARRWTRGRNMAEPPSPKAAGESRAEPGIDVARDAPIRPVETRSGASQTVSEAEATTGGQTAAESFPGAGQTAALTRVLTLPGAEIRTDDRVWTPPPFTILYRQRVREVDGETWYAVGRQRDRTEGWVREGQTEEWRSMLVMQYAPLAGRNRVLFFREPDHVRDVLDSHFTGPETARALYQSVRRGDYDPSRLVAIEPERPVRSDQAPYFMPIIDFRRDEFEDANLTPVFLLQLAAVNLESSSRRESDVPGRPKAVTPDGEALSEFRAGMVFVVDATVSMGPYIREVQDFLRAMRTESDRVAPGRIDFGLIGYRDNISPDPRIGYTTETFLPLGTPGGARFEEAVSRIAPARVSTRDWREDAFAGLQDAIERIDWSPYDARFVLLVTDAGPRAIGDALARDRQLGARSVGRMAERRDISLHVLHMQTDEGQNDHAQARAQYAEATQALGDAAPRYWTLSGDAPAQFGAAMRATGREILSTLKKFSAGDSLQREPLFSGDPIMQDLVAVEAVDIASERDAEKVGQALSEQFFVFQQEYLGRREGEEAPDFYRAWVADRDLVTPRAESMAVKVLVTRAQLSDLAARLSDIVRRLDEKQTGTQDAFASIAGLSGVTAYDPNLTVSALLPEYLAELPYGSTFMTMTAEQWGSLGQQQQGEILNEVRDRIRLLESINASAADWLPLPGRSAAEEVYPLDLDDLP